ncbi:MAG: nitroreductase [Bacteroidota bacterium]
MRYNLSEIKELIKDRRTVYPVQYSKRSIHKEIIEELLNSAIWAPTHGMSQPWRFKVYRNEGLQKLSEMLMKEYHIAVPKADRKKAKEQKMEQRPLNSSAAIFVTMERPEEKRIHEYDEMFACAAAIQNILLHATAHGIGSFWSTPGFIRSEGFRERQGLSQDDWVMGIIYLGYPEGDWPKGQRKPIEYVTEWIEE